MRIRASAIALFAVLLLTGCTLGGHKAPPSPPTDPPGQSDSPGSTGGPATPSLPVKSAPDRLQRLTYDSTAEIPGPGLYLINLPTGKVERWQVAGTHADEARIYLSADRRWVVAEDAEQVYWANRQSGQTFTWSSHDLKLWAAGRGGFLFEQVQEGAEPTTFHLVDSGFELQRSFTLELAGRSLLHAQFAPDGQHVALKAETWPMPAEGSDAQVYLVDLTTGTSLQLGPPPMPDEGQVIGIDLLGPATNELVVSYISQIIEPTGLTREKSIVRRFSWQGHPLGEFALPGRARKLSPDGRLLLWGHELDRLARTTVLTDLTTGQPLFRVVNADGVAWTADGSALTLVTAEQGEYLVSMAGELRQAPSIHGGDQPILTPHLVPAPDHPNRLLAGLAVVEGEGRVLHRIDLPKREDWMLANPAWGADGDEVLLTIMPRIGKGNLGTDFPLPPRVQRPPFSDPYLLQVQDPLGECLNLRESFSRSSAVIRCLPTGTRLAVADLFQAPIKLNGPLTYGDDQLWFFARTEQDEIGWVSLSAGSLTWAD